MVENYKEWDNKVDHLTNELLKKESILNQYAIWLKSSEDYTLHKGADVYNMLVGALQNIEGTPDFIPGTGWENFVAVIGRVQKKTGLDLGVCQFLTHNIENSMKAIYREGFGQASIPECGAKKDLLVGSLKTCIPPDRCGCIHRIAKLEKMSKKTPV